MAASYTPGRLGRDDAAMVCEAGRALFGADWQAPTARLLKVSDRTVRRLAKALRDGEPYRVNRAWITELAGHLDTRAGALRKEAAHVSEVAQSLRA